MSAGFSDEQLEIIGRPGTFYVDACPGAGKTHAIVERFIRRPHATDRRGIALISFTRAAADEVLARTADNPDLQQSPNFIDTIDAFINRYVVGPAVASQTGRRPTFRDAWSTVPNTTITVLTDGGWPVEFNLDWFTFSAAGDAKLEKSRVVPQRNLRQIEGLPLPVKHDVIRRASARWNSLISAGFIDCAHARTLMRIALADPQRRASLGRSLASRFHEAIVDEFQDCNYEDLELLRLLKESGVNIVLIGDLEQSIYGFRDAEPADIRKFLDGLGRPVPLSGNFRSSPAICGIVSSLRSTSKVDRPVGKHRALNTPVYTLRESNLADVAKRIAPLLINNKAASEDLIFLAHARWAAQQAAGAPKQNSSNNRVLALAEAAVQFRTGDPTERSKASKKVAQTIRAILADRLADLSDDDLFARAGVTHDGFRYGLVSIVSSLNPSVQSPRQFMAMLNQRVSDLGWHTWIEMSRLKTPASWPDDMLPSTAAWRWSTIHGFKGRQSEAVVLIMTDPPDRSEKAGHVLWQDGEEGEARRTLYVGASRAERLLILVAMKSVQYDAAIRAMDRYGVSYIRK